MSLCFIHFSIKVNKCSGIYNDINDPYAKFCAPDEQNINVKVFNLMSCANQARHIEWHETCKYKCRLDPSVCNNKQRWNEDKCRSECKEFHDKEMCDKGIIWNRSDCNCKCDKSCYAGECLYHKNCKCRRKIVRN